ncbi:unnamed protein product [Clavelina lepadiformis]|uniref:Uncharacterized protein n=1 Tax=Clavelina lepadiformis TaxID=159417 RepID=A0ABP0GWG7_CLALP
MKLAIVFCIAVFVICFSDQIEARIHYECKESDKVCIWKCASQCAANKECNNTRCWNRCASMLFQGSGFAKIMCMMGCKRNNCPAVPDCKTCIVNCHRARLDCLLNTCAEECLGNPRRAKKLLACKTCLKANC